MAAIADFWIIRDSNAKMSHEAKSV